jgi:hypothetical protein
MGRLASVSRLFCALNLNPCETSEQNSIRMALFRENTQRRATNAIRFPLLVFTISHDFTLNTEIRCVLL